LYKTKVAKKIMSAVFITVILALILWPFFYIFVSSFKPLKEIMAKAKVFPVNPTLKNYKTLIIARTPVRNFPRILYNSFVVSSLTAFFSISVSSISGYGIARSSRIRSGFVSKLMLFIYVFPTIVLLIPIYKTLIMLGLWNSHYGLVIIYTAINAPFCTWLLVSFFETIPKDLEESAQIDGASGIAVFFRIIMPLATPGLITVGVYSFITAWGEYMFALVMISENIKKTAALGLAMFTAEQYIEWGPLLAGSILIMVPVFALFLPISKFFIKGFTAGAVKE
jgi:ABC-type glycerol-3-phosphate transport system permease component